MSQAPHALLISADLFFGSKVTGTAAAIGLKAELAGSVTQGLEKLAGGGYRCVILDLAMPGLSPGDVVDAVRSLDEEERPRVIAFGSHVHTALLAAARAAGCDEVMPRSRFSAELVQILKQYCGEGEDS